MEVDVAFFLDLFNEKSVVLEPFAVGALLRLKYTG